jgi:hypothetical protein
MSGWQFASVTASSFDILMSQGNGIAPALNVAGSDSIALGINPG